MMDLMGFTILKKHTTLCPSGQILILAVMRIIGCMSGIITTDGYIVQLVLQFTDYIEATAVKREDSIILNTEDAVKV